MVFKEIIPGERLRHFVKCYFIFESDTDAEFEDTVFPGGCLEVIFNLGDAEWKLSNSQGDFYINPKIELWGQITKPLPIKTKGRNIMFGIKFFTYSAAYFFEEGLYEFNNQVSDLSDIVGGSIRSLHSRLLESSDWNKRIDVIENFLIARLVRSDKRSDKIRLVSHIVRDMKNLSGSETINSLASGYGISSRYLQKLFLQYVGITPNLHRKISRFQHSLKLLAGKDASLTSISYDCGYFDQSHFIRDFKSFTGILPSEYSPGSSPFNPS